jgi:hypothetical protein
MSRRSLRSATTYLADAEVVAGSAVTTRVLVPTALAAVLLSREFPSSALDVDGTLFTVSVYGVAYSDVVGRVRSWMRTYRVGPALVTDDEWQEELLVEFAPRSRHSKTDRRLRT